MNDSPYTDATAAPTEEEPLASGTPAAEIPSGLENLTAWDEPPTQSGGQIPSRLDDPDDPSAELVEQGIEEADRELRLESMTEDEDAVEEPV